MSDIYLSLTETPSVVTLSQPVIASSVAATVTVGNTVTVALDANSLSALENVTVTVGTAVSISNFPASQVISGSVTVTTMPALSISSVTVSNLGLVPSSVATDGTADGTLNFVKIGGHQSGSNQTAHIVHVSAGGSMSVDATDSVVSISNFPSTQTIVGTVTANINSIPNVLLTGSNGDPINDGGSIPVFLGQAGEIYGTVTAIIGNTVTIGTYNATYQTGSVLAAGSNISIIGGYRTDDSSAFPISVTSQGRIRVFDIQNSVTIGSVPNGSLTTRFGTPTTANTAFATSCVTNANRKYLLIQNVTTGSNVITVGIGFTPTTTQGIQLTAGAGITFESSYIPTGAVQILSSVTASNFTILEA